MKKREHLATGPIQPASAKRHDFAGQTETGTALDAGLYGGQGRDEKGTGATATTSFIE
jgi:hypothetical protein